MRQNLTLGDSEPGVKFWQNDKTLAEFKTKSEEELQENWMVTCRSNPKKPCKLVKGESNLCILCEFFQYF